MLLHGRVRASFNILSLIKRAFWIRELWDRMLSRRHIPSCHWRLLLSLLPPSVSCFIVSLTSGPFSDSLPVKFPRLEWLPAPPSGAAPVARCCLSPRVFSLRRPLLLFQIFFAVVWELRQVSRSCVLWPSASFLSCCSSYRWLITCVLTYFWLNTLNCCSAWVCSLSSVWAWHLPNWSMTEHKIKWPNLFAVDLKITTCSQWRHSCGEGGPDLSF